MNSVFQNQFYIKDPNLFDTYVHSHVSTFMETYKQNGLNTNDEYGNALNSITKKVKKAIKDWNKEMVNAEKEFLNIYNKEQNTNMDSKQFIAFLDSSFKENNGTIKSPILDMNTLRMSIIQKNDAAKKAIDPQDEENALNAYRIQIEKIGIAINNYLTNQSKYLSTFNAKDASQYSLSKDNLEKLVPELNGKELQKMNRKSLNELYGKTLKALINIGWLFEPIAQRLLGEKLSSVVVGNQAEMMKNSVVDLLITTKEDTKNLYGINLKSQEEKYEISRVNYGSLESVVKNKTELNKLNYIRRNLGMLKSYNINYENYDLSEFRKIFAEYNALEEKFAFLNNLISALDNTRNNANTDNIYSILIGYQGGFIWTSSLFSIILEGLDSYLQSKARRNRFDSMKVITASFDYYGKEKKDKLRKLFQQKKKIIKQAKKEGQDVEDFYPIFYGKINFPFDEYKSVISQINYTINLAAAKTGGSK